MTSSYEPNYGWDYEEEDYDHDYDFDDSYDSSAEEWEALTDGQYGDYPGGVVDYDFMGW